MRRAAILAALVLAACGGQPDGPAGTAVPASSAAPASGPGAASGELLFAVLQPGGDLTVARSSAVAIVRTSGLVRARARFVPRQLPNLGGASVLTQPEARAAAGKVYFADGSGTVRSLAADGTVAEVTTFPVTGPQQLLSFAVSPDGSQLMGAVFSFPPLQSASPPGGVGTPFGPGDFFLQLYAAELGRAASPLAKKTWAQSTGLPRDVISLVGWSDDGPLATSDTQLGTNQGSLGRRMFGHVALLDVAGRPGPPLGGYGCSPWSVLADGTVLCDDDGQLRSFSVRRKDGSVRFQLQAKGDVQYLYMTLAPDASRVAYLVNGGRAMVTAADGKSTDLPVNFLPHGWLDPATVIGAVQVFGGDGNMALVRLDRPSRLEDLGFKGFFVGVI